jgi:hypothetical protein
MNWIQNSKKDGNLDKMKYYAEGMQKFVRQPVSSFPDISDRLRQSNDKVEGR